MRLFIDMDGTLAEWRPAATEAELDVPGYFYTLKPHRMVLKAVQALVRSGVDVYILSAVRTEGARQDKIRWLKEYFPELPEDHYIFNQNGTSKAGHLADMGITLTREDVLLDDYTKNLDDWTSVGGTAVKFINPGLNNTSSTWLGYRVYRYDRPEEIASTLLFILENEAGHNKAA